MNNSKEGTCNTPRTKQECIQYAMDSLGVMIAKLETLIDRIDNNEKQTNRGQEYIKREDKSYSLSEYLDVLPDELATKESRIIRAVERLSTLLYY